MFGKDRQTGLHTLAKLDQPRTATEALMEMSNNWEASRTAAAEKSERRAWKVAGAFGVGFTLSTMALIAVMPLKESVPFLLTVSDKTGAPDLVTMLDEKNVTYSDVMDKYWLAQYVLARETYDWYTLQNDYNTVGLLSSKNVGAEYAAQFEGKDALDKKYGAGTKAIPKITSVIPTGRGTGTVRFTKTTKRVDDTGPGVTEKYVATISYEYRSASRLFESQRLINPFGWQARTYRVDPELPGGQ